MLTGKYWGSNVIKPLVTFFFIVCQMQTYNNLSKIFAVIF